MRIIDIFDIHNGETLEPDIILENPNSNTILYLRPSNDILNTVSGYVNRENVKQNKIFPKNSIIVGTNGEGSHTYSYVIPFDFTANSDVAVLLPKNPNMLLSEKIFYSKAISTNRPLFSYGRKPKGKLLKNIFLPPIPYYIKDYDVSMPKTNNSFTKEKTEVLSKNWESFKISDLFQCSTTSHIIETKPGNIPYVTRTGTNNGIDSFISEKIEKTNKGNCITIGAEGYFAFYQPKDFISGVKIYTLRNARLNKYNGLFITVILNKEIYRYGYGRARIVDKIKEEYIKLPTDSDKNPDWQYMEDYIKSLPYGDLI